VSERLRDLEFVDLIIGEDYADMRRDPGAGAPLSRVPAGFMEEIAELRQLCKMTNDTLDEPEFGVKHGEQLYRVTMMTDPAAQRVFFLSRPSTTILSLNDLPLPEAMRELVMNPAAYGEILVAGPMSSGKTTTVASMLVANMVEHGSSAITLEDPIETLLEGRHGSGRCIQTAVSRRAGTYEEQLKRTLRTRVALALIGEIRDRHTAYAATMQSVANIRLWSTTHAASITDAISRQVNLAAASSTEKEARDTVARGLNGVIYQQLHREDRAGGGTYKRVSMDCLVILGSEQEEAVRNKIREGRFHEISNEIDQQRRKSMWCGV
jgi:Tfp pilus assembly pilus retraction ATPase PilT